MGKINYSTKSFGSYGVGAFYQTRFNLIHQNLSEQNKEKFNKMSLMQKKNIVNKMIQRGTLI